jgi:hypothetical protein
MAARADMSATSEPIPVDPAPGVELDQAPVRLTALIVALVVAILVVVLQNVLLDREFPHLMRLTTDFSPAYLEREIRSMKGTRAVVFLGDSVLWGYRLPADQNAVSLLAARGCTCRNLSFKSGNPPNAYALERLMLAWSVVPRAVVIEVNQSVFNPADMEYQTLHPAIAALAAPLLSRRDLARLTLPPAPAPAEQRLDGTLASVSELYAMRADIRETLYGDVQPSPIPNLTGDMFEGTYNLVPLDESNVGVHFLERAADLLQRRHVELVAFLTPTNHALLHDYIDNRQYRANEAYLARLLERRGARVLDLDHAFPTGEFFDNAHLTAAGQRRLASLLAQALRH